jgi:hypothetical protein
VKEHVDRLVSDLDEEERAIVLAVLKDLFFVEVRNAYETSRVGHRGVERQYRADKRITHPECFTRYFLLRPSAGELTDSEVEAVIESWQTDDEGRASERVLQDLRGFESEGRLSEIIQRIRVFLGLVGEGYVGAIARGLYRLVDFLQSPSTLTFSSDYDLVQALVLRLIEDRAVEAQVALLLEEVVRKVGKLHFAVLVALSCHRASQGSLFRISENVNLERLREIVSDRLRTHYIAEGRDIFAELPPHEWSLILFQWGTDWMTGSGEHRAEVQDYVRSLWERRPAYIGLVLTTFVEKWGESPEVFRLSEFSQLYDAGVVKDLLSRHERKEVASSPEARKAVDVFVVAVGGLPGNGKSGRRGKRTREQEKGS